MFVTLKCIILPSVLALQLPWTHCKFMMHRNFFLLALECIMSYRIILWKSFGTHNKTPILECIADVSETTHRCYKLINTAGNFFIFCSLIWCISWRRKNLPQSPPFDMMHHNTTRARQWFYEPYKCIYILWSMLRLPTPDMMWCDKLRELFVLNILRYM